MSLAINGLEKLEPMDERPGIVYAPYMAVRRGVDEMPEWAKEEFEKARRRETNPTGFYRDCTGELHFLRDGRETLFTNPGRVRCDLCGGTHVLGTIYGIPPTGEVTQNAFHKWMLTYAGNIVDP